MPSSPDVPQSSQIQNSLTEHCSSCAQAEFQSAERVLGEVVAQTMTSWRPGQPIPRPEVVPFEEVENFRETPPEGLDIQDVDWIWWTVASGFTYEVLRGHMSQIIDRRKDWGCLFFLPYC